MTTDNGTENWKKLRHTLWWPFVALSVTSNHDVFIAKGHTISEAQQNTVRLAPSGTILQEMISNRYAGAATTCSAFLHPCLHKEYTIANVGPPRAGRRITPNIAALLGNENAILLSYFEYLYQLSVHLKESLDYDDALSVAEELLRKQLEAGMDTKRTVLLIDEIKRLMAKKGEGTEPVLRLRRF